MSPTTTLGRDDRGSARDRLLTAAARLLEETPGGDPSTRAICALAGVQAPTLYHHFGSKQGLVEEVVNHGFTQYLETTEGDALAGIRDGWDRHVQFGLDHPAYYALLYGRVREGVPCAITGPALGHLEQLFKELAAAGRLTATAADAAARLLAANVGVTLTLITQAPEARDTAMSHAVRDTLLRDLVGDGADADVSDRRDLAARLRSAVDSDPTGLSAGERALLGELLTRLATSE